MTEVGIPREERIRRALDHLRNDTTDEFEHVTWFEPVEFTDPEIAKLERERVFGRVPSIIIHGSEIAGAGDFVTLQLPRNNVIVVRQRDGSVKTLVNQCRHRGAMVEKYGALKHTAREKSAHRAALSAYSAFVAGSR